MAKAGNRAESRRDALLRENERLRLAIEGMRSTRRYTVGAAITRQAVKYGFTGFFGWLCVRELAGRVTVVNAAVDMCTSFADALKELVHNWLVQIVTIIVCFTALIIVKRTRRRSKRLIARLADLTKERELAFDPGRSSSKLGRDGDTNVGDGL